MAKSWWQERKAGILHPQQGGREKNVADQLMEYVIRDLQRDLASKSH